MSDAEIQLYPRLTWSQQFGGTRTFVNPKVTDMHHLGSLPTSIEMSHEALNGPHPLQV